jgi:Rrf2 family protein
MLSKKTKYAIKALVALSKVYKSKIPLSITSISQSEDIPHKFLEGILLELKNQGILTSRMGLKGGYLILKDPKQIMLSTIIRATGGPIALAPCVSINFYAPCDECLDETTCGLRNTLLQVRVASIKILSKTSLADIVKQEIKLNKK